MYRTAIQPDIRIKPYCVFCGKMTENVETYNYYDPLGTDYDRILIRFPAHRFCFLLRKACKYCGLLIGLLIIIGLPKFLTSIFPTHEADPGPLPLWVIVVAGITGLLVGGFVFFRMRSRMVGTIHEYYVLNENIPEADKSWRRNLGRYQIKG